MTSGGYESRDAPPAAHDSFRAEACQTCRREVWQVEVARLSVVAVSISLLDTVAAATATTSLIFSESVALRARFCGVHENHYFTNGAGSQAKKTKKTKKKKSAPPPEKWEAFFFFLPPPPPYDLMPPANSVHPLPPPLEAVNCSRSRMEG